MNGYQENQNVQIIYEEKPKMFDTEISNNQISIKIKKFAKIFFQIYYSFSIFLMIFGAIGMLLTLDETEGISIIAYLVFVIVQFISICISYIGFLFLSGYGALIEDVNAIKEKTEVKEKATKKTK